MRRTRRRCPSLCARGCWRSATRRITDEGVIVLNAQRFRTQERNREDARTRLAELIRTVLTPPKPRVATRPTRASKERRLTGKRERSQVKRTRSDRGWERDS